MANGAPFDGPLAGFADALSFRDDGDGEPEEAPRLCLARFHAATFGPWRASCSLWGQIYFNALLIPATCQLAAGWRDDALVARFSPTYCPRTKSAERFCAFGARREAAPLRAEEMFVERLEQHLGAAIEALAEAGGLSQRMLWESASQTLQWAATEISARHPACASRLAGVARRAPAGSRIAAVWRGAAGEREAGARRFCCLRYQLPGSAPCAGVCPRLPDKERAAPTPP